MSRPRDRWRSRRCSSLRVSAFLSSDRLLLPSPTTSGAFTVYLRALVRQCRRLLVTSMSAREMFVRAKIDASKIVVWRPGVDCAMFAPSMRSVALRERWGVSDALPAIVCAGTLSDDRGAQRLLSMELALHRTRPMHQMIVVGDGPNRNAVQARCPNAIFIGHGAENGDAEGARLCRSVRLSERSGLHQSYGARGAGIGASSRSDGTRKRARAGRQGRRRSSVALKQISLSRPRRSSGRMRAGTRWRWHRAEYAIRQDWAAGLSSVYAEYRWASEVSRASARFRASLHSAGPTLLARTAPSLLRRGASRESCSFALRGRVVRLRPNPMPHGAR